MKKILIAFLLVVGLVTTVRYFSSARSLQSPSLVVINVLDKHEYDDCHIKNSQHVDLDEIATFARNLHKDTQMVVYCSNYWCTASDMAAHELMNLGFRSVYVYRAGMAEWFQAGLPVEGQCKEGYLTKIVANPHQQDIIPVITTEELKNKMELAGLL